MGAQMKITQTKYITELPMRQGQTEEQLDAELSEFCGTVLAICELSTGSTAACGFESAHWAADYLRSKLA